MPSRGGIPNKGRPFGAPGRGGMSARGRGRGRGVPRFAAPTMPSMFAAPESSGSQTTDKLEASMGSNPQP